MIWQLWAQFGPSGWVVFGQLQLNLGPALPVQVGMLIAQSPRL